MTSVEVPPLPLGLMVVQLAGLPAFRTGPLHPVGVRGINVDFSGLQVQLHRIDLPGGLDAQNAPIQFAILHPGIVACRPHRPPSTHYKPGRAKFWGRINL